MKGTYLVEQRLDPFLLLPFTDLVRIRNLEELRRNLDKPFGFDGSDSMAILPRREQKFVIDTPLGIPVE